MSVTASRLASLACLATPAAHALIWQPPFGTASGNMQSAVSGPTSGPMQKLFTITITSPQPPSKVPAQIVGFTSTGVAVILGTITSQQYPLLAQGYYVAAYQNALPLYANPTTISCQYSGQQTCQSVSVAFDDNFIYVATTGLVGQGPPYGPYSTQSSMTILNLTTGATLASPFGYNGAPSPLTVFVNAADAPGDGPGAAGLTWVTGNYSALAGVFDGSQFAGGNSTLSVNVTACTLGHQLYAVCELSSPGGMAVLRADGPGGGPALVWDDFVGPLFIADDVGPNGALVVDTDYGGYYGNTLVACDLATGSELWAFAKPANATISAWAYNGAGILMLKSFFDAGAQFSARFDTFAVNSTTMTLLSTASARAFPPPAGEDSLTFDAGGATAYTFNSDGGDWTVLAIKAGVSGAGAISSLFADPTLQTPTPIIAGPKATQLTVQDDAFTVAIYM